MAVSNVTDEELEARGIKNYTYYYYYDYQHCHKIVYSILLVAGNCLNNKTEVYCSVAWFDSYNTSSTANLTIKGMVIVLLLLLKLS